MVVLIDFESGLNALCCTDDLAHRFSLKSFSWNPCAYGVGSRVYPLLHIKLYFILSAVCVHADCGL